MGIRWRCEHSRNCRDKQSYSRNRRQEERPEAKLSEPKAGCKSKLEEQCWLGERRPRALGLRGRRQLREQRADDLLGRGNRSHRQRSWWCTFYLQHPCNCVNKETCVETRLCHDGRLLIDHLPVRSSDSVAGISALLVFVVLGVVAEDGLFSNNGNSQKENDSHLVEQQRSVTGILASDRIGAASLKTTPKRRRANLRFSSFSTGRTQRLERRQVEDATTIRWLLLLQYIKQTVTRK